MLIKDIFIYNIYFAWIAADRNKMPLVLYLSYLLIYWGFPPSIYYQIAQKFSVPTDKFQKTKTFKERERERFKSEPGVVLARRILLWSPYICIYVWLL